MKSSLIIILIFLLIGCERVSGEYRLEYVQDGDSVILCCNKKSKTFIVRLKDIDAPEKHQPFAQESRQFLKQLIADKSLQLIGKDKDRYGRQLVDIIIKSKEKEISVNKTMIETGHAWVWRYSDNLKLQWLQGQARKDKKGLWALEENQRIEPWKWRRKNPRKH